jgi:hypothetical protein
MVKFQLPEMRTPILAASYYRCGNHVGVEEARPERACRACLKFSSNSIVSNLMKAFVDFVQKLLRIANNSFKPVC